MGALRYGNHRGLKMTQINEWTRKWLVVLSAIGLAILLGTILYSIARPQGYIFDQWELETPTGIQDIRFPLSLRIPKGQLYRLITTFPKAEADHLVLPNTEVPIRVYLNGSILFDEFDWAAYRERWIALHSIPIEPSSIGLENRLVLEFLSDHAPYVEIEVYDPPHISGELQVQWRRFWLKLFEYDFFVFSLGATFFLGILLLFLANESKENRRSFRLIGVSNLLACFYIAEKIFPYIPISIDPYGMPSLFYILGITYSSFFAMAGVEHYHYKRFRISRFVGWIPIPLIGVWLWVKDSIPIVNVLILIYIISLLTIVMIQSFRTKGTAFIFPFTFLLATTVYDLIGSFGHISTFRLISLQGYGLFGMSIGIALAVVGQYRKMVTTQYGTNIRLEETLDELGTAHEELERSYLKVDSVNTKLEMIINLSSKMVSVSAADREIFLSEVLEMAKSLIPEADYGSVSVLENGKWRFIHAIGHDASRLRMLDLTEEQFVPAQVFNGAKIFAGNVSMINHIMNHGKDSYSNQILHQMKEATQPIKQTLLADLVISGQRVGQVALDIAEAANRSFSDSSAQIMSAFGNIASAFLAFQELSIMQEKTLREIVFSMIQILEIHDSFTKGHSEHVAKLAADIARQMDLSEQSIHQVYWAGMVHDIGKILVPQAILNKPSRLSALEYEIIQLHSTWGYDALKNSSELRSIARIVKHHHERYDGNGYPDGISSDQIPLASRIIFVADAWDAMIRDRSFRQSLSFDQALKEITVNSGSQFDPIVVNAFLVIVEKEMNTGGIFS
jgi:HD superfamily phosphohydrolase YqeK